MKKVILLMMVCLINVISNAQGTKTWDFPIKPGTEEWKQLKNNKEKVEVCQIPEDVLKNLSTPDLMEICMNYPLLNDVLVFNNINEGFDKLYNDFNGMRELSEREDFIQLLNNKYINKLENISILDKRVADIDKGEYIVSLSMLEILLCNITKQNAAGNSSKALLAGNKKSDEKN